MDNLRAIEILEHIKTFNEFKGTANNIAIEKGIKALKMIESLKNFDCVVIEDNKAYQYTGYASDIDYDGSKPICDLC